MLALFAPAAHSAAHIESGTPERPRVVVLTDIGIDPDDEESLVRLLLYTNEMEVEGLIATTSTWQRDAVHPELIEERVRAYGAVLSNLRKHAPGYPAASSLLARIKSGPAVYGLAGVGEGKDGPASELLIAAVERPDPRPVWITDWGGANVLAQALWKVRSTRSPEQLHAFVSKLRVYSISDQDDAGPWIRRSFPELFWIASVHAFNQYRLAAWGGISGEHFLHFDSGADFTKVGHDWLRDHIRKGPLGAVYPDFKYIMEGDSPSFLYLVPNGLGVPEHPEYGSWGGRYGKLEEGGGLHADTVDQVTGQDGKVYADNRATIWRWRDAFQNDFAARIQWTLVSSFKQANHNPILTVNGVAGLRPVEVTASAGARVTLDAAGSYDPDHDPIHYHWWQYQEVSNAAFGPVRPPALKLENDGSARASFVVPAPVAEGTVFHVILEVHDDGAPSLTSYRRVIVTVGAAPR
jgi:Protein of unknown function (DUF1593)